MQTIMFKIYETPYEKRNNQHNCPGFADLNVPAYPAGLFSFERRSRDWRTLGQKQALKATIFGFARVMRIPMAAG